MTSYTALFPPSQRLAYSLLPARVEPSESFLRTVIMSYPLKVPDDGVLPNVDTGLAETDTMPNPWRFNKAGKATASRILGITYQADWLVSNANYFEDTTL